MSLRGIMLCDVPTHYGECMIITMNRGLFTSGKRTSTMTYMCRSFTASVYLRIGYLFKIFGQAGEVSVIRSKKAKETVVL